MKAKRYASADRLLRDHAHDPVGALLADVTQALEAAESDGERRAISRAATDAARTMGLDGDDTARFTDTLARLTDPDASPLPYRVWSAKHGNVVSIDELTGEDPRLAKAVEAIRSADTAEQAYSLLRATRAAVSTWGLDHDDHMVHLGLLDAVFELEVENDGTATGDAPTVESVNADLDAAVAASLPAPEAPGDLWDRITRLNAEPEAVDA